jgi:hypothetical protein
MSEEKPFDPSEGRGQRRVSLEELATLLGAPAGSRITELSYTSEPDGTCELYSHDGDDPNAHLTVEWEPFERTVEDQAFYDDVAAVLKKHRRARMSGGFITDDGRAAGVQFRVYDDAPPDGNE